MNLGVWYNTNECIINTNCLFLYRLDQLLHQAVNLDNGLSNSTDLSEASEWDVAITEIRAQLYMLSGHLLFRLAKEVSLPNAIFNVHG